MIDMILFAQNRGPKAELQCTESMKYIKNKTQNGKRRNKAQHETTDKRGNGEAVGNTT